MFRPSNVAAPAASLSVFRYADRPNSEILDVSSSAYPPDNVAVLAASSSESRPNNEFPEVSLSVFRPGSAEVLVSSLVFLWVYRLVYHRSNADPVSSVVNRPSSGTLAVL